MNTLLPTRLKFPAKARKEIVTRLNAHLADLLDQHSLQSVVKTAQPDEVYTLDLFFAERHTSASTFRIETSITDFVLCP